MKYLNFPRAISNHRITIKIIITITFCFSLPSSADTTLCSTHSKTAPWKSSDHSSRSVASWPALHRHATPLDSVPLPPKCTPPRSSPRTKTSPSPIFPPCSPTSSQMLVNSSHIPPSYQFSDDGWIVVSGWWVCWSTWSYASTIPPSYSFFCGGSDPSSPRSPEFVTEYRLFHRIISNFTI